MNYTELVAAIAEGTDLEKTKVNAVLTELAKVVGEQVAKGEKVTVKDLFIAERGERAARQGRNPQTGETMTIPAAKTVKLKAAAALKRAVA